MRDNDHEWWAMGYSTGLTDDQIADPKTEATIRPLVVIDPEDAEQVQRIADLVTQQISDKDHSEAITYALAGALRESADPTPPRPDEPTGLGAVVEDEDGKLWVRSQWDLDNPWTGAEIDKYNTADDRAVEYEAINVARIVAEGVAR